MIKQYSFAEIAELSAIDWLKEIAERTRAFRVEEVISQYRPPQMPDKTWDYRVLIAPQAPSAAPPFYLNIEVKARLNPQIAWQSLAQIRTAGTDGAPTICCRVISPGVADMCRDAAVSYYDGNGNAHIAVPGFLLHVESQARRPKLSRAENGVNVFSPKSSRIARVLLGSPSMRWQVQTLAHQAQVSIGLASRVKDALLYQRFVDAVDGRLGLVRPRELLEKWAGNYTPPAKMLPVYMMGSPADVEQRIARWCDDHGVQYALAQFSGAWRVAPMIRYQRSAIYLLLDPAVSLLIKMRADLGAKEVESGANVSLLPTIDPSVFFGTRTSDHFHVVSPIQLYLDLKRQPGRGQEAAEEIFEKEIAPTFRSAGAGEESHV